MDYVNSIFSATPSIEILINPIIGRKQNKFRSTSGQITKLITFYNKETVSGEVNISVPSAQRFNYLSINIELVGLICF